MSDSSDIMKMYNNGFTNYFFDRYKDIKRFLPFIPSATIIGKEFNNSMITKPGHKVFLFPSIYSKFWHNGISDNMKTKKEFYVELIKYLAKKNITCVVWQNFLTYDLSEDLENECIFLRDPDALKALAAMRSCSCVLDFFSGISRLALIARSPFLCYDERSRHSGTREYEIDSLGWNTVPHQYNFSFSTIITDGDASFWKNDIFQSVERKLEEFLPSLNRDALPTTAEAYENVPYHEFVQPLKKKKLGTKLIRVPQE